MQTKYGDLIQELHPFVDIPQIIVHGTNCLGYMNSGFAKQLRDTYPFIFDVYKKRMKDTGLILGDISYGSIGNLTIVNANTQQYCRGYVHDNGYKEPNDKVFVDYNAVYLCFEKVKTLAQEKEAVVNYPLIGAGLANGDWNTIADIIDSTLGNIEHNVWIYK